VNYLINLSKYFQLHILNSDNYKIIVLLSKYATKTSFPNTIAIIEVRINILYYCVSFYHFDNFLKLKMWYYNIVLV